VTRAWTDWHRERYEAKQAVCVRIQKADDIAVVTTLPRLLSLWVIDPLKDDTVAFDVVSLQELVLYTRSTKPLGVDRLPNLANLVIDGRPGLDSARSHPPLRAIQVHSHQELDLRWLGVPPRLQEVALHGRWRPLDVAAATQMTTLRALRVTKATMDDLSPARSMGPP
jgi:hypothetical protein